MQTYSEFERQRTMALREKESLDLECVHCPSCGSQWFSQKTVYKFQANHNVILGQDVPTKPGAIPYYILKCVRCENLLEPRVIHTTRDIGGNDYDDFLDTLEGKGDTRQDKKKVEEEKIDLTSVVQGLQQRIEMLEDKIQQSAPKKVSPPRKK